MLNPGARWVGGLVKTDFRSQSGSHWSSAWIQNPSVAKKKKNPYSMAIEIGVLVFLINTAMLQMQIPQERNC